MFKFDNNLKWNTYLKKLVHKKENKKYKIFPRFAKKLSEISIKVNL